MLTGIRSLILLWSEVTDIVGERIRPNVLHSSDGSAPSIKLELVSGSQQNFLDRSGCLIDGVLEVTSRSELASEAALVAEMVRSRGENPSIGLDGYSGSVGSGVLKSAERIDFDSGGELLDDGSESGLFVHIDRYQILFEIGG